MKKSKSICVACGKPVEFTPKALLKHCEGHSPAETRICFMAFMTQFVSQMDKDLFVWRNFPVEIIRGLVESKVMREALTGPDGDAAMDMLVIRLQCAEAFHKIAEEHAQLLALRMEVREREMEKENPNGPTD